MYLRACLSQLKVKRCNLLPRPPHSSLWLPGANQHRSVIARSLASTGAKAKEDIPQDEEIQKWGWSIKLAATVLFITYAVKVGPELAETTVRHSVKLVGMKDPFFQRSGAYRLSLIAMDEKRRQAIVKAGAVPLLVALLDPAGDERTNARVMSALARLAHSDAGVEAIREANVEPLLDDLAGESKDLHVCEGVKFVLERLRAQKDLPVEEGVDDLEGKYANVRL